MPGETRDDFMARVRGALKDRGKPVDLPDDLEVARVIRADSDTVGAFLKRAEEAYIHAHRVGDDAQLVEKVAELIDEMKAGSAIVPNEDIPARDAIVEMLRARNVRLLDADDPDAAFSADVGITGVTAAVAESASMVIASGGNRRRLASLAVPTHIAIVHAEQIVPDLLDWFGGGRAGHFASEVLVSAPSKTADIELALVMGVHGPKDEHVIVIAPSTK